MTEGRHGDDGRLDPQVGRQEEFHDQPSQKLTKSNQTLPAMTYSDEDDSVLDDSEVSERTGDIDPVKIADEEVKPLDVTQDESVSSQEPDHGPGDDDSLTNEVISEENHSSADCIDAEEQEVDAEQDDEKDDGVDMTPSNHPMEESESQTEICKDAVARELDHLTVPVVPPPQETPVIEAAVPRTSTQDKFTEPLLKDKINNPSLEHQGKRHSAVIDKFHDPLLKEKIHNPNTEYQGTESALSKSGVVDKFTEPPLKEKIKNPVRIEAQDSAFARSGVLDKFTEPLLKDKVKNPTKSYAGAKHSAVYDKFTAPQLKGSVKSPPRHEWGKDAPKGKFEWVQVGGKWTKKYESEDA